ncbi:hypothetical protein RJ639_023900 [Escallonia herrerae]|uniref:LOB domain-containing protein n=1 Tax=Escallonia herrerae TaxID=1293975 RepID=A0AA89ACH3_9ASTE|nr:hypothetical protein RJ639_023900 [Escallonia herrerae]
MDFKQTSLHTNRLSLQSLPILLGLSTIKSGHIRPVHINAAIWLLLLSFLPPLCHPILHHLLHTPSSTLPSLNSLLSVFYNRVINKTMTLKGGTNTACAACKYQRRRCNPDCALAPYFPADKPKMFENAHRLFGVKKIVKMLERLDVTQQKLAMNSIIYQANMRNRDPVYGCTGQIGQLAYQIQRCEEELHAVLTQLALHRQHEPNDSTSQLQLGMAPPSLSVQNLNPMAALPNAFHYSYSDSGMAGYNTASYIDFKDNNVVNSMWAQQAYINESNKIDNPITMQSHLIATEMPVQQEAAHVYSDEIHPFFDTIDDRQSYIDSKEAYDSSSESSLKDTTQSIEHVAQNELKSAAARLSLTSVN